MRAWQVAHTGLARCCSSISRTDAALPSLLSSRLVFTFGRRRRHRRRQDVLEQPLAANRRRGACRVRRHRQHARLSQQAPAVLVGQRHAPEVAAVHAGNPVVTRELLVEERVVRRQQIHDAAVRLQLIVEEQLRLAARTPCAGCRRTTGNFVFASGVSSQTLRVCSHWPKKLSTSAVRARGSASMRRTWRSRTSRFAQLSANRQIEQLVVRDAAPEEERQARGELDVGETIRGARRDRVRIGFDAKQEIRADEQPLERRADAAVEVAVGTAALIEAEQRLDVVVRHRPAIRTPRQRRQDLRRAGGLVTR